MKWNQFRFKGGATFCGNKLPHAPHVVDHYNTVANGCLEHFCPGKPGNGFRIHINEHRNGDARTPGRMAGEWCFDPMGPVTHVLMKEEILDYAGRDYWKVTYQQRGYGVSCATIVAHDTQEAWEQARGIANFRIPGKVISVKRLPVKKMTVCVDLTPVHTFTGIFGFRGKNDLSLVTEVASESGKLKRNHAWLPLPEGLEHGQKIQFTGKWMEHLSGEEWVFGPELIELKTEGLSPPR